MRYFNYFKQRFCLPLLFVLGLNFGLAQNLNITSSGGETGTSGTNWSITGTTLTVTGTANIRASVIVNALNSGSLTIVGNTTSFNVTVSESIISTGNNSLTFAGTTNTGTITINASITNGGLITINTGAFNIAHDISTTSTAAITISAANGFSTTTTTRRTISTQGGNITINADNDANGTGWLDIDDLTLNPGVGNLIIRGETFNVNGTESRKPYINGTGSFTFESNDASFGQNIESAWFVIDQDANGISGLNLGKSESTANVSLNSVFTVAGPINVYGAYVSVTGTITSLGSNDIFLKGISNSGACVYISGGIIKSSGTGVLTMQAHGRVDNSGTISATGTGVLNLVMWSDYDGDNVGGGSTHSGTISTNGGHVWMGGSNSNGGSYTWNGLAVGDGPSVGAAGANAFALDMFGPITTNGGDLLLWAGNSCCGNVSNGIVTNAGWQLNVGNGDIIFITPSVLATGGPSLFLRQNGGTFTLVPNDTSFPSALNWYPQDESYAGMTGWNFPGDFDHLWIENPTTLTNLSIGQYEGMSLGGVPVEFTNTSNININFPTTIAGSMNFYGGDIAINHSLTTTSFGGDILVKAIGKINLAASKVITTNAGDVNLWADSDDNSTGYVQLLASAVINSNGGDINLGGGSSLTSDHAFGTTAETCPEEVGTQYISGVHLRQSSSLNSNGGNISVRGQNANTAASALSFGVSLRGVTMNSGTGKISLNGIATGSGSVNAQGVASWGTLTLRSANTSADAISINGNALSSVGGSSLGVNIVALFEATGPGGGITINGKSGVANTNASVNLGGDILAASGPITISGENISGVVDNIMMGSTTTIGKKSGTNVTSSSSNVILEGNRINTPGAVLIDCIGTVTVQPFNDSFASALSWPMNNLTLSNAITGLTLGKSTNTSTITFANATNIAGPITAYGGDIAVNENLNTTAGNANGDVLLKSAATISIAASKSIITNGGNITFWADNDANGTGGIKVDDNVTIDSRTNTDRTGNAHTTGGGKITFAGGLDDGGTASGTSLLTTGLVSNDGFPDGYAVNSGSGSSTTPNTGIVLGTIPTTPAGHNSNINIFSGSGDIRFNGLVTNNTGATGNDPTGLLFFHGYTINGGTSGNVILLGNSSVTSANGCIGMDLAAWRENSYTADGIVRTVNGSINVVGRASGGTSHNLAIAIDATNTNGIKRNIFAATGSGSISIDGLATGTSPLDVRLTNVDLLSGSGAITTIARGTSGIHIGGYNIGDGLFIGQKSGSLVESSTSAISLIADNIQLTKPLITNSTGALIFESLSNSFTSNITLTNKTTTAHSSLRIGKITNAFNISIGGTTSIAGPIDVYGRNIYINDNLNTTAGNANGDVLLKSTADISVAASKSITTNAGDVILWSDSDSNNNGSISLLSAATIQTSGGKIVLAGGSDDGSNSGIASDGIPDGYSKGVGVAGISTTGSFNLNSGSGDILLRGSSDTLNGVLLSAATSGSINSAGGKIDIIGLVDVGSVINGGPSQTGIRTIGGGTITLDSGSGLLSLLGNGPRSGIGFGLNNANETDAATQTILTSSNTTAAAISIKGTGVHGITFRGATTKLHATAALGGITIDANSTIWSSTIYNPVEILAVSGPINWLNSTSSDGIYSETTSIALGSKSGVSGLTSSSSNINFYLNKLYGTPAFAFGTTGQVKIQGVDGTASFGQAFNTNTFGLNSNAQTMSAFTFGTPANTNDLTFGSATSIAGPITAYGGTITLNANLTTTNNGDISLYTDNPIAGLGTPRTLTAAGAFKYIPRGTTFSADVTYPIANLTATSTGLTIGNATNDKNITIDADVTGGAGIELYGNNVNINSNLTTTGTSAIMHLKGNTTIAAGKTITSGGNFTHDGNLTFKSDVNGTAAFGTFGGTTFTKQSGITTVERYVPAKRAWRLLTAPLKGTSNATVPNNWQGVDGEGLLLFSPATYQSQTMTGYTTGGGMPNIWKYNSSNNSWLSIPNITTENLFTSTVNNGFLVFATGPKASTNIVSGADITTLKPQGDLITGVVEHSLSADKYHLIGNPYASPLNTEAMVQANAGTKVYMVDPTMGTVGGYVTYDGTNWAPAVPILNDKNIQSGQGFFVRKDAAATFTISESHKITGNSNDWFGKTSSDVSSNEETSVDKIRVLLYKQINNEWQLADGILAVNSTSGNNEVDATDTGKMTNFNENIAFRNGTSNLSIEYRVLPTTETIQPMRLTGTTIQPYQLRVKTENYSNSDLQPYLEDTQTGVLTLIPIDGSEVVVNFTGIAAISSNPDSRFRIVYPSTLGIGDPNTLAVGVYPNPVEEDVFTILLPDNGVPANYTLTNLLGQQVQQGKLDMLQNSVSVSMLQGGVYLLQVVQSGKTFTSKLIIK